MKILVTGGAGFIGGHAARQLLQDGHEVVVLDDLSTGRKQIMVDPHEANNAYTFVERSICDDLSDVFEQHSFDAILHFAALARVQFSIDYPQESHHANVNGTLNLLLAARNAGVKRFVFSSSSSIYGDQETLPVTEDMKPNYLSPYGLQKFIGEEYCRLFHVLYEMETISLRYFNVYGPEQNPEGHYAAFIPKFIKLILSNTAPTIYGDGEQTRDFTFVSDVVRANILAATTTNTDIFGQIINIGGGENNSINTITKQMLAMAKSSLVPEHAPPVIESRHTRADISRTKSLLSWQPEYTFSQGLTETFEFYKSNLT